MKGISSLIVFKNSVNFFVLCSYKNVSFTLMLRVFQEYGMEEIDKWLPKMDCVVVGPGLGKNQSMFGR